MLKELTERRDMLKRKRARLKKRKIEELRAACPSYPGYYEDTESIAEHDEEIVEIDHRLKLYSDYKIIQSADEDNIKSRLKEIVATVIDEQSAIFKYCEKCQKEREPDVNECSICSGWDEPFELADIEFEAYDMLDILDGVEVDQ